LKTDEWPVPHSGYGHLSCHRRNNREIRSGRLDLVGLSWFEKILLFFPLARYLDHASIDSLRIYCHFADERFLMFPCRAFLKNFHLDIQEPDLPNPIVTVGNYHGLLMSSVLIDKKAFKIIHS